MYRFLRMAAFGTTVALSACASTRSRADGTEFHGRYRFGFEVSDFVSCDAAVGDSPWWALLTPDAVRERDRLIAQLPPTVGQELFVRVRGAVGEPQPAGHLGAATRYVSVTEVLELRPVQNGDCGLPSGVRQLAPPQTPQMAPHMMP